MNLRFKGFAVVLLAASLCSVVWAQEAPQMPPRIDGAVNVDQHTTAPLQFSRSAELNISADRAWRYLNESRNVAALFDDIRSVSNADVGNQRTVILENGARLTETVVEKDSATRTFAYSIADRNPMGISDHLAVLTVAPADQRRGSVLTWNHYFAAEDGTVGGSMSESLDGALAALTTKHGGYEDHGSNEGFNPVVVRQSRIVDASRGEVWAVLAEGFAEAHIWSSSIASITVTDNNGDQIVGDQRACFIPAFNGETKETITQYDEEAGIFAYSVDQGLPPFVTDGEATWTLVSIDRNTTRVTVEIEANTAPGAPPQAIAFFRGGMSQLVGASIDEAKYFIEQDEPHPRKIAALSQSSAAGGH